MPVLDWTLVDADVFHDLHTVWIGAIRTALNDGILPADYYALAEQHFGMPIADVLTLHASDDPKVRPLPPAPDTGGLALAEAPPKTRRKRTIEPASLSRRRSIAIRHVSEHRLVALLEIVSSSNKDRERSVQDFVDKAVDALEAHVHLLVVDLFPPDRHDGGGMHGQIINRLEQTDEPYDMPANEPLTLASYSVGPRIETFVEHLKVGDPLPDMPLFLRYDRYVNVPLESTYQAAYRGLPAYWRGVLESRDRKA